MRHPWSPGGFKPRWSAWLWLWPQRAGWAKRRDFASLDGHKCFYRAFSCLFFSPSLPFPIISWALPPALAMSRSFLGRFSEPVLQREDKFFSLWLPEPFLNLLHGFPRWFCSRGPLCAAQPKTPGQAVPLFLWKPLGASSAPFLSGCISTSQLSPRPDWKPLLLQGEVSAN